MKFNFRTFFRIILAATGVLLLAVAVIAAIFDRFHEGSVALILIGVCFIALSVLYLKWHKVLKWLAPVFCACFCLLMALCLLLCLSANNLTFDEDVVIVLGLETRGDRPSKELENRLDLAVEYHKKNPDALIILSGGACSGTSQSLAMKEYLMDKGVHPDRLITENASCNTYENFLFSKEIITLRTSENCRIGFITSNYHVFRAQSIAKSMGMYPTHGGCVVPAISTLPSCVRECIGIARFWLLGY